MRMDFIGPFKKFVYNNTYIYNLVDYFSRHIYPHPTSGAGVNNVIISYDHYLRANPKPYAVYMDAGSHFTSQKLRIYFQKKDIAVVFAPSASHKSVGMIEKSNDILQQAFKKMREPGEEWEDALFRATPQVNSRMIEHLGYSPVEIITGIQPLTSIERKIRIDSLPTKLKVPTEEQMFPLVWDYMARRIDIREDVYDRSVRKKEQEKIRYDKGVKTQYFKPGDFVLLKDSTPHLGKLTERWRGPFIIDSFGGDHGASYILKTLEGEPAPNTHHGDHLRIFRPREGYLRPTDEEPLQVTRNLRYRRKRD